MEFRCQTVTITIIVLCYSICQLCLKKKIVMIHGTRNLAHPPQNGIADLRVNLLRSVFSSTLLCLTFIT